MSELAIRGVVVEDVNVRSTGNAPISGGLLIGDAEAEARVLEGNKVLVPRLSRSKHEVEMPRRCVLELRGALMNLEMQPQLEEDARMAPTED